MNDKLNDIQKELYKNEADKHVCEQELYNSKKEYIERILKTEGEYMKSCLGEDNKPIKFKKPLSVRVNDFLNRLKTVFNIN